MRLALLLVALALPAFARPLQYCQGNSQPSRFCKTCEHCRYCSGKGNTAVCAVCETRKLAEAAARRPK